MFQEPAFAPQAAGISGEGAVAADNAVAGNDDGQFVFAVGGAYGPDAFRVADAVRQLQVRDGMAERDVQELLPYGLLEVGTGLLQGQLESFTFAGKVFVELLRTVQQQPWRLRKLFPGHGYFFFEQHFLDMGIGTANQQYTYGSVYMKMR